MRVGISAFSFFSSSELSNQCGDNADLIHAVYGDRDLLVPELRRTELSVLIPWRCLNWLHTQAIAEIVQDKADGSQFRVAFWRQDSIKILAI